MYPFMNTAWAWVVGFKFWLAAIAVTSLVAFGAGYYKGNDHVVTKYIDASVKQIASAKTEAAAAQKKQDDKDWREAQAASAKRIADLEKRNGSLEAALKAKHLYAPNPTHAFIPAAGMKKLNDPDLVGETQ